MNNHEPFMCVAGYVSLDITPRFPRTGKRKSLSEMLRPGKLLQVGKATISPGGCVTNTGLALHQFGARTFLAARIGDDAFGHALIEAYRAHGADPDFRISEDETSYTIAIAPPGCDRIFLADSGANDTMTEEDIDPARLAEAEYFHFGYPALMRNFYVNAGENTRILMQHMKERGMVTSLDTVMTDPDSEAGQEDMDLMLRKVLPFVDFFVPSIEELCYMIDRPRYEAWQERAGGDDVCMHLSLAEDVIPLAEKALSYGCKAIMLKCGAAGLYLQTSAEDVMTSLSPYFDGTGWGDIKWFQKSYVPDQIISGTGAGDTAIAAFLYGASHGYSPIVCAQIAAGTGSCNLTASDSLSGLMPIDDLMRRIEAGWETQDFIRP